MLKTRRFAKTVRKRKGEKIKGKIGDRDVSFRKYKAVPKGCSTPRQVCIKCLTNVIHKNDSNYESKICKSCI